MPLCFLRPNGTTLKIVESAFLILNSARQDQWRDPESGGILLGRVIQGSGDIVVDEATKPNEKDVRKRFSFFRRKKPAQERVNLAWCESSGTRVYLGEWHSHPEDTPEPSTKDIRNWERILADVKCECDALFFVIVGRGEIRAWEGSRQDRSVSTLQLRTHGKELGGPSSCRI